MFDPLQTDIKYLKGVGPLRAKTLGEDLNIFTLRDLLYNFPYKYIDRSVIHQIKNLTDGMPYVLLRGQIVSKISKEQGGVRGSLLCFRTVRVMWSLCGSIASKRLKRNLPSTIPMCY